LTISPRYAALAVWLVALSPCFGKEAVYLQTGFRLEVDSHKQENQRLILRMGDGTLELPVAAVSRIEILPDAPVMPPAEPALSIAEKPEELVTKAADEEQLPPEFVRSVAKVESGFRQDAVSAKGALGLMQLMPSTAAILGMDAKLAPENAQAGALYLRDLLIRYRGDSALALAAYNAGPGAVSKFGGVPPYAETRRYVQRVLREYERQKALAKAGLAAPMAASKPTSTN